MRKDNIVRVASKDTDSSDSFDLEEFAAKYARDKSPGGVTSRKRSKGSGGQRGNKASGMSLSSEEEALFVAISFGKVHRIERFLKTLDDLNIRSAEEKTPLIQACSSLGGGVLSHVTRMLLRHRTCDVNACDVGGRTALMHACMDKDKCDTVRILVRNTNCDTNVMDENGYTALMHATQADNTDAMDILLFAPRVVCKVDVNKHSLSGSTAVDIALERRNAKALQTLVKQAGADTANVHDVAQLNSLLAKRQTLAPLPKLVV